MATTLIPAFGRDYKSKAAVLKDWNADKDFIIADLFNQWDGKPANKSGFCSGSIVNLRYKNKTMIVVATV